MGVWLACIALMAGAKDEGCNGGRGAGRKQRQLKRMKTTAMEKVDVHLPFRLFQALNARYNLGERTVITVSALSTADHEDSPDADVDDGPVDQDGAIMRTSRPTKILTSSLNLINDEDPTEPSLATPSLSSLTVDDSPSASTDSSSGSPPSITSSMDSSSSPAAVLSGSLSDDAMPSPITTPNTDTPSPATKPSSSALQKHAPHQSLNFSLSSSGPLRTNSTADVPQVPAKISRNSPAPPKAGEFHPCVPISAEGDATYCVPPNAEATGTLGYSGSATGESASPNPGSVRICPRKGEVAIDACHPHLQSFNAATNSCIAPEDSECVVIYTSIWKCTFSSSPSFTWKLTSVEALTRTLETKQYLSYHHIQCVINIRVCRFWSFGIRPRTATSLTNCAWILAHCWRYGISFCSSSDPETPERSREQQQLNGANTKTKTANLL